MLKIIKSTAFAVLFVLLFSFDVLSADIPLINSENPLPQDFVPSELTEIKATRPDGRAPQKITKDAAVALEALIAAMENDFGTDSPPITVTSGYRSYNYQKYLFDTSVQSYEEKGYSRAKAETLAARYTARPGESEHQSGLCVDIHDRPSATVDFENSPYFLWLCENAHRFGYILRYPRDKENITKIAFEPWHWRYVGRENAEKIKKSGLCLEEYLKNS